MSQIVADDLGYAVTLTRAPRRVVSLVPSLTEAIVVSAPGLLVGATRWCVHPAGLEVDRVGGTKNPDVERIVGLRPDLVVANEEENRRPDVEALRDRGLPVWVTDVRSVPGALRSLARLLEVIQAPQRGWLAAARTEWTGAAAPAPADALRAAPRGAPADRSGDGSGEHVNPRSAHRPRRRAAVAIWRRPWMWLGGDTYAGDLLGRVGVDNVLAGRAQRYPRVDPGDLPEHDLVVLPDEPYPFGPEDGPEAFTGIPVALVDGQSLTWYGPRMLGARARLTAQLAAVTVTGGSPGGR